MAFIKGIFTYLIKVPLSFLYGTGVYVRNKFYDWGIFKSVKINFPIINIGNITVGGTGKTPHVEYILSLLSKHKIATLSRGYKRQSKGFRYVEINDTAKIAGDEPLQIKQKFPEVKVAVEANRVFGVTKLLDENDDLQAIILDDAFQHRKLSAGLNIILIDYNRPVYRDHLLPWGHLRDNKLQLPRADIFIVTKCPNNLQDIDLRMFRKRMHIRPYQELYFTTLEYGEKRPVFGNSTSPNVLPTGNSIVTITGIASPSIFIDYVKKHYGETKTMIFPDHHNFTKKDIAQICELARTASMLLTTEKDFIRLQQWENSIPADIKAKIFYIPIKVKFLKNEDKFIKHIFDYVRTNKSNSQLY